MTETLNSEIMRQLNDEVDAEKEKCERGGEKLARGKGIKGKCDGPRPSHLRSSGDLTAGSVDLLVGVIGGTDERTRFTMLKTFLQGDFF